MGRIPMLYILHSVIAIVINFYVSGNSVLDLDPIDTRTYGVESATTCIPRSPRNENAIMRRH
jgi:hypothetical protein